MSKGSNRRPGSGYVDGWSRIFGASKIECSEVEAECSERICQNCMHYVKEYSWFECINKEVVAMAKADYGPSFEPPVDFGCNKWEKKV